VLIIKKIKGRICSYQLNTAKITILYIISNMV